MYPISVLDQTLTYIPSLNNIIIEGKIAEGEKILSRHFEFYRTIPLDNADQKEKFQRSAVTIIITCGENAYVTNFNAPKIPYKLEEVKENLRALMRRLPIEYFNYYDLNFTTALISKNDDDSYEFNVSHHLLGISKDKSLHYNEYVPDIQLHILKQHFKNLIPFRIERDLITHCLKGLQGPKAFLFEKKTAKAMRIIFDNALSHHLNLISIDQTLSMERLKCSVIMLIAKSHTGDTTAYASTPYETAKLHIIQEEIRKLIYQEWNAQPGKDSITINTLFFERINEDTYACESFLDSFSILSEHNNFSNTAQAMLSQCQLEPFIYTKMPSFKDMTQVSTLLTSLEFSKV